MRVGMGIIRNIKTKLPVCRVHRKRLIVDIAGNALLRHFDDDLVSLLGRNIRYVSYVEMP